MFAVVFQLEYVISESLSDVDRKVLLTSQWGQEDSLRIGVGT